MINSKYAHRLKAVAFAWTLVAGCSDSGGAANDDSAESCWTLSSGATLELHLR